MTSRIALAAMSAAGRHLAARVTGGFFGGLSCCSALASARWLFQKTGGVHQLRDGKATSALAKEGGAWSCTAIL